MSESDTDTGRKQRNSTLEVLRIISMLLIVFHHAFNWGAMELPEGLGLNTIVYGMGMFCGQIGVVVFFLITGYFMVTQKFTVRKLVRMVLEIWFYSWSILLLDILFGDPQPTTYMYCLFPLSTCHWWFVEAYIALMILSPFINRILNSINARRHLLICAILFFLTYVGYIMEGRARYAAAFGTAVTVYVIAAYIRLHPNEKTESKRTGAIILAASLAFDIALLVVSASYFDTDTYRAIVEFFDKRTSVNELMAGLGLFLIFVNMKPRYSKTVNAVAASTFGVYLIHQSIPVKHVMWSDWLEMDVMFAEPWFPLYAIGCALAVFSICVLIDKLRVKLVFEPLNARIENLTARVEAKVDKMMGRF